MKTYWGDVNFVGGVQVGSTALMDSTGKIASSFLPSNSDLWTTTTTTGTSFSFASLSGNYIIYQCGELTSIATAARTGLVEVIVSFLTGTTVPTVSELSPFYFYGDDCAGGMFAPKQYRKYIFRVKTINDIATAEVQSFPRGALLKYAGGMVSRTLANEKCTIFKTPVTQLYLTMSSIATYTQVIFQASANEGVDVDLSGSPDFTGSDCANYVFNPIPGSWYLLTYVKTLNICMVELLSMSSESQYAPLSSATRQTLTTTTGTIALKSNVAIYQLTPTTTTTISFNSSGMNGAGVITFELAVVMPSTAVTIDFSGVSLSWLNDDTPDLSAGGRTYLLAFRSFDGGTSWVGNLQGSF